MSNEARVCENCRFWTRDPVPERSDGKPWPVNYHFQYCRPGVEPEVEQYRKATGNMMHKGVCSCEKFDYQYTAPDGLGYMDAECYAAAFETGARFGCIHFDAKEEES